MKEKALGTIHILLYILWYCLLYTITIALSFGIIYLLVFFLLDLIDFINFSGFNYLFTLWSFALSILVCGFVGGLILRHQAIVTTLLVTMVTPLFLYGTLIYSQNSPTNSLIIPMIWLFIASPPIAYIGTKLSQKYVYKNKVKDIKKNEQVAAGISFGLITLIMITFSVLIFSALKASNI